MANFFVQAGTIFVMTHDSIGLGEDGPTHQPIEHLASFRAMPNILMMRPGDGNETAGCYKASHRISLATHHCAQTDFSTLHGPSIVASDGFVKGKQHMQANCAFLTLAVWLTTQVLIRVQRVLLDKMLRCMTMRR